MTINRLNRSLPDLPKTKLVGEWRFTDYGDQTLRDYSGNGKHAVLGANTTPNTDDPTWSSAGLTFDAANSQFCGGSGIALFTGTSFTFIVAMRASGTGYRAILGGGAAGAPLVRINATHQIEVLKSNTALIGTSVSTYNNQWVIVGTTYDGTTARFFRNGMPDGAATSVQTMVVTTNLIGKEYNGSPFAGEMAYLVVYDRALIQPEVEYASTNIARQLGLLPRLRLVSPWGITAGGTTYTDTGTGILTGIGSGDDANAYVDTGSAASIFVGSGADAAILIDAGTGVLIAVGSGADAPTYADSGTGILIAVGSGADAPTYADSGTGILTGIGSGDDSNAYVDTGTGVLGSVGSGADTATLIDAGTGVLIAVGSGSDAPVYADSGTAIMGLFGSGSAVAILADTGTGILIASGSGFDTGGQPIIRGCAALTQEPKPRSTLFMQTKPIASIAQRPC